jgi:hypothetical protein
MLDRERAAVVRALLALSLLLLAAAPVLAYGGPGAGVEFIGYFLSLLTWLGVCFSAVFLWPIYALLRKIRGRKNQTTQELPQPQDAAQPAEAARVEQ